jgi:hypothetical protein
VFSLINLINSILFADFASPGREIKRVEMLLKVTTDSKSKLSGLFKLNLLFKSPSNIISRTLFNLPQDFEQTLNTTNEDIDKNEYEDIFIRNVLTARKKQLIRIFRVDESGSPILQDEQEPLFVINTR